VKTCAACGREFARRKREKIADFKARRYCTHLCELRGEALRQHSVPYTGVVLHRAAGLGEYTLTRAEYYRQLEEVGQRG
jgi:hypothetical protein